MFAIPIFDTRRFFNADSAQTPLTIAVSSCLTGAAVRYDRASKSLAPLRVWSPTQIRLLPICPEVGAGLTVPRPPVQLVATDRVAPPRARGRDSKSLDVTTALKQFAQTSTRRLQAEPTLCGYIWKSRSPSCGLGSTPLFNETDVQIDTTSGIQARHVVASLPWLVHIEETQLMVPMMAARFLLQCRLVLDLRATLVNQPDALPAWHRHYAPLHSALPAATRIELQHCAEVAAWEIYLAQLNQACENIEAEQLLGLFTISAAAIGRERGAP